jgi:hypothetical protein
MDVCFLEVDLGYVFFRYVHFYGTFSTAGSACTPGCWSPPRSGSRPGPGRRRRLRCLSPAPGSPPARGRCRRRGCGSGTDSHSTGARIDCRATEHGTGSVRRTAIVQSAVDVPERAEEIFQRSGALRELQAEQTLVRDLNVTRQEATGENWRRRILPETATYVCRAAACEVAQVRLGQLIGGQIDRVHVTALIDGLHDADELLLLLRLDAHADASLIVTFGIHAVGELRHIVGDCGEQKHNQVSLVWACSCVPPAQTPTNVQMTS